MSHICIVVVSGMAISVKKNYYEKKFANVLLQQQKQIYFQDERDGNQPLLNHYKRACIEYLYFSVADSNKFNNCEEMFVTCTEHGECWEHFQRQMKILQMIVRDITKIVSNNGKLDIFLGDSGSLYEDFEQICVDPDEIYQTLYQRTQKYGYWNFDIMLNITHRANSNPLFIADKK